MSQTRKRLRRVSLLALLVALLGSMLPGCGGKKDEPTTSADAPGTRGGKVDSPPPNNQGAGTTQGR